MILIKRTLEPIKVGVRFTKEKYAFFPILMKKSIGDAGGKKFIKSHTIWLEPYIDEFEYYYRYPSLKVGLTKKLIRRIRLAEYTQEQFEK